MTTSIAVLRQNGRSPLLGHPSPEFSVGNFLTHMFTSGSLWLFLGQPRSPPETPYMSLDRQPVELLRGDARNQNVELDMGIIYICIY